MDNFLTILATVGGILYGVLSSVSFWLVTSSITVYFIQ